MVPFANAAWTLPVRMFSYITTTIRPTIAAIAVLFLLLTLALLAIAGLLARKASGTRMRTELETA